MSNNPITAKHWDNLVSGISRMAQEGIGIKCPFCGEKRVHSIMSGILEVRCGTRIAIKPNEGSVKHVVTQNGHALAHHGVNARYPYKEFDCKA